MVVEVLVGAINRCVAGTLRSWSDYDKRSTQMTVMTVGPSHLFCGQVILP